MRYQICLLAANGHSNNAIAKELRTSRPTVLLWRKRFKKEGLLGLSEDAPHGTSDQRLDAQKVRAIVDITSRVHLLTRRSGAREQWQRSWG